MSKQSVWDAYRESSEQVYNEWRDSILSYFAKNDRKVNYEHVRQSVRLNDKMFIFILKRNRDLFRITSTGKDKTLLLRDNIMLEVTDVGRAMILVNNRN